MVFAAVLADDVPALRTHDQAFVDEEVGDLDRRAQEAARVVPEVEDQAAQVTAVEDVCREHHAREVRVARDEQELFSHVVSVAEKQGKSVELLVVPAVDPFDAMVQTAARLQVSKLVVGVSARMASEELASRIGLAWERLAEPRHAFSLEITNPDRPSVYVNLGPHPPRLWPEDVDRLHRIWLRLCANSSVGSRLHHRDVVGMALRRLEQELEKGDRHKILDSLESEIHKPDEP